MSATGRSCASGYVRDALDFFETPAWCVRAILPHLPRGGDVLDPGCGTGAILRALLDGGFAAPLLVGAELDAARADEAEASTMVGVRRGDFLDPLLWSSTRDTFSLVIGNPPFNLAMEFVQQALSLAAPVNGTVAMLLRLPWVASQKRAAFHQARPCDLYILPKRPSFTGGGTDSTDYAWFVWGPGRGNRWSILDVEVTA